MKRVALQNNENIKKSYLAICEMAIEGNGTTVQQLTSLQHHHNQI